MFSGVPPSSTVCMADILFCASGLSLTAEMMIACRVLLTFTVPPRTMTSAAHIQASMSARLNGLLMILMSALTGWLRFSVCR